MTQLGRQNAPSQLVNDFAARDETIRCLSYGVMRKLAGLPRDLFAGYWRDVLGTLLARLPGVGYYVQHHFSPDHSANLWPLPDGVRRMDVVLDGAAEIGFADIDSLNRYAEASAVLFGDVFHLFEHIVAYSLPRGSHTPIDPRDRRHSQRAGPVAPSAFASERRFWRRIPTLAVGMGAAFGIRAGGAEVAPASAGTVRQRASVAAVAPWGSSGQ
jgi:hypothetical protein